MAKVRAIELSSLERLAPADVRLLWVNDWYPEPAEAMVDHHGAHCLMVVSREEGSPPHEPYHWIVWRLSPEHFREELHWHSLFAHHVGNHWCTHDEPHEPCSDPHDPESFYAALRARTPLDLTNAEAIGYLDELPAR